ncbi:unnamed protein product [Rhizoctonia solani]|uniref:F-box domain-containing protein n=1 Tax=Rhizoctonia solani TaxID=456999 RepID=A0A8H3AF04_9AGAM|nr:unnamed protein product [Rhizoctonia solani]
MLSISMLIQQEPTNGIVQQWKDALRNMTSATAAYLDRCKAFDDLPLDFAHPDHLEAIIGVGFKDMDTLVAQPLSVARSFLARTWNRAAPRICSVPPEVLLIIFSFVLNSSESTRSTRTDTFGYYRRLHTLAAVCSIWRRICISQGFLWSLIPIYHHFPNQEILHILCRAAGSSKLHLVAELGATMPPNFNKTLEKLVQNGHRFNTINLMCETQLATKSVLEYFLDNPSSTLGSITNMYLYSKATAYVTDIGTHEQAQYVFSWSSAYQASFSKLVGSLRSLRIRHTHFHLTNMKFVNLVELWLQELDFSPTGTVQEILRSVSSASNLRIFRVASILARGGAISGPGSSFSYQQFSFPNLEKLWVEDVQFTVLKALLLSIQPRPDSNETIVRLLGNFNGVTQDDLEPVLRGINISTLVVVRDLECWKDMSWLLECMPTLTTMYIDGQTFEKTVLENLVRPSGPHPGPIDHTSHFPAIRELHITRARIQDPVGFEHFVASYPIHRMVLGARAYTGVARGWEKYSDQSDLGKQLKEIIPDLDFVDPDRMLAYPEPVW